MPKRMGEVSDVHRRQLLMEVLREKGTVVINQAMELVLMKMPVHSRSQIKRDNFRKRISEDLRTLEREMRILSRDKLPEDDLPNEFANARVVWTIAPNEMLSEYHARLVGSKQMLSCWSLHRGLKGPMATGIQVHIQLLGNNFSLQIDEEDAPATLMISRVPPNHTEEQWLKFAKNEYGTRLVVLFVDDSGVSAPDSRFHWNRLGHLLFNLNRSGELTVSIPKQSSEIDQKNNLIKRSRSSLTAAKFPIMKEDIEYVLKRKIDFHKYFTTSNVSMGPSRKRRTKLRSVVSSESIPITEPSLIELSDRFLVLIHF